MFPAASGVDAHHSVFNHVGRDQYKFNLYPQNIFGLGSKDNVLKILQTSIDIPLIVDLMLHNDSDSDIRRAGAHAIGKLVGQTTTSPDAIKDVIPLIIKFLEDSDSDVRTAGAGAICELAQQPRFHIIVEDVVPLIIEFLKDSNLAVRRAGADAIITLAQQSGFHDAIRDAVPLIIGFLKDSNSDVRRAGADAISKLAQQPRFYNAIKDAVPLIIDFLADFPLDFRKVGSYAISELSSAQQSIFHNTIKDAVPMTAIPQFVEFLNENSPDLRVVGACAISKLAEQATFHNAIKGAVPMIVDLLNDGNSNVRLAGAYAIGNLAQQSISDDVIKSAVPQIFELLKGTDLLARSAGVYAIGKLAAQATFHNAIKGAVPLIIDFLNDSNLDVRRVGTDAILTLAQQATFHDAIKDAIPQIIEFLVDRDSLVRLAGAGAICKLAEQPIFHDTIKDAVPMIVNLLNDSDSNVRLAGAYAIGNLAEQSISDDVIKRAVPLVIKLLKDMDSLVRSADADALARVAEPPRAIAQRRKDTNVKTSIDAYTSSGSGSVVADSSVVDAVQVDPLMCFTVFGAQDALDHITSLETEIDHILSTHSLLDKSVMLVGFDESAVAQGWGLLQRVYLLSSVEPDDDVGLCDQLGRHFSPYSGTVITPTKILPTPVFKEDGHYYTQAELIDTQAERLDRVVKGKCSVLSERCKLHSSRGEISICNKLAERSEPGEVHIAGREPEEVPMENPGERSRSDPADIGTLNDDEASGENMDNPPTDTSHATEHHTQDVVHGDAAPPAAGGGELPPPGSTDTASPRPVRFIVKTNVYLDPSNSKIEAPYQSLKMSGSVEYQVEHSMRATGNISSTSVKFTELNFQSVRKESSHYNHRAVRVDVDCGCKYTRAEVHQPHATKAAEGTVKITRGKKSTNTVTAGGGILPTGLTGTAAVSRVNEASNAQEVVHLLSQIKQHDCDGLVWWHYDIDDANDKTGGLRLDEKTLPITDFYPLPQSPNPMPSVVQVSVGSFWSLQSSTEVNWTQLFHPRNPPRSPRHMNLYGQILLEIPADLANETAYMETIGVYPDIFVPVVELHGDVHVQSLVAHVKSINEDGNIPLVEYTTARRTMTNEPRGGH